MQLPFVHLLLLQNSSWSFWMWTRKKNYTSPSCIPCMVMSQIIPLYTLMLIHNWYEKLTPREALAYQTTFQPTIKRNLAWELKALPKVQKRLKTLKTLTSPTYSHIRNVFLSPSICVYIYLIHGFTKLPRWLNLHKIGTSLGL